MWTRPDPTRGSGQQLCNSVSASLHKELSEWSIFVMNKMKIKLVGNISRISLK